ncbi:MAG TPA: PepSY-associated TM helix domain-containing protein [Dysgonamonadaceae bacterium]|nr:PepSY-associated TM helix domain-containing protein [Dysgonamonadaceae bacterium]HOV35919.1 PepSY-associated TM helix domain-containing protein [Dysgonamonadaceae bacterium]HPD43034.1 PepSY-associated TM helix domain-containing protein [Dysgonamonadaceae bacterium]HQG08307.1 PepSY-associated TM helix domain-containing protein [Dysgonamonadaceae bacterium]HRU13097.1 PepSY-associated TM helix domain-containing protein [Dysgonamonadaceae bacterium]
MKRFFYQIHLWLGLVSGLLVFLISITGALYAFQEEISGLGKYHKVEVLDVPKLPPSQLQSVAERVLPGKTLHSVKYNGKGKSAEAIFYGYNPNYYYIVYLDPYSGKVLKVKDMNKDFFRFILMGHFYLWLPPQIGQPLVAGSTLIFLIVLISGIIVWLPKRFSQLKKRLTLKWGKKVKWQRVNYDLHVVGGIYASIFGCVFAISGLVWGYPWFAEAVYKFAGGDKSLTYSDATPKNNLSSSSTIGESIDKIWLLMRTEYPNAASIEIHPPRNDSTLIAANATQADGKYWKTDYRYFDCNTLTEVSVGNLYGRFADADTADKLMRMNYEIHTGAILGLPGKIIAFFASIFIAGLPITGFVIWWRKRGKKEKRNPVLT